VTGNCGPEAERFASAEDADKATSNPARGEAGCCPGRWLDLAVVTGASRASIRDNGGIDFKDATDDRPLTYASRIPFAARKGVHSILGLDAVAEECLAIYSGALLRTGK
jgi:hypothetical protein